MAVHDGNHPERLFIGRVGDHVITDTNEAEWTVSQISAFVCRNVASDFVNISAGFRMKLITLAIH